MLTGKKTKKNEWRTEKERKKKESNDPGRKYDDTGIRRNNIKKDPIALALDSLLK